MILPFGLKTVERRTAGLAVVSSAPANAGTMESSSGNAKVVPTPRKNVRRGIALLKIVMVLETSSSAMGRY